MKQEDFKKLSTCEHIFGLYANECTNRCELLNDWEYDVNSFNNDTNFIPFKYCPLCGDKIRRDK